MIGSVIAYIWRNPADGVKHVLHPSDVTVWFGGDIAKLVEDPSDPPTVNVEPRSPSLPTTPYPNLARRP